jgi:hypothetical protein
LPFKPTYQIADLSELQKIMDESFNRWIVKSLIK